MTTISLKLQAHDLERLKSLAKERRTTQSALVRQAIQRLLKEPKADKARSFRDTVRDLSGIVDGPADLSTNPKHMDGYGK
jgi:Arc/MetJ-type ribon-helix-helix transcriptional regulator